MCVCVGADGVCVCVCVGADGVCVCVCVFSCRFELGRAGDERGAAGGDAGRQRDAHQRQRSPEEPKPPLRRRESQLLR